MKWMAIFLACATLTGCSGESKDDKHAETVVQMIQDYRLSMEPTVNAPEDAPPKTVKIGKTTYKVVFTQHDFLIENDLYAYSTYGILSNQIVLDPTMGRKELQENVVHELLHCMMHEAGGYDFTVADSGRSRGHRWIRPITPVLAQVLRENPELVKWLQKE
jgi:hypothetical protein